MRDLLALFEGKPGVTVRCPACQSRDGEVVIHRNGFSFVRCSRCFSLYVNPRPSEESLLQMYQRFPEFAACGDGDATCDSAGEMREARYRLKCVLEMSYAGRLLDVGIGTGAFLSVARTVFDVAGVDLTVRATSHAVDAGVVRGLARSIPFAQGTFSVVTAFEVLEHLFEIGPFLNEVHRVLCQDGVFVVQTGEAGCLTARFNLEGWRYLLPPVHLNVLSRKAFLDRMEDAGFEKAKAWSFGRAPSRTPLLARLPGQEAVRPVLDLAARAGLIGQLLAFRRKEIP